MIKSLVPNFDYLKEILFKLNGSSEGIDPFIEAVKLRTHTVGRHRFFAKKDKDQSGKWVVPSFSGFVIAEEFRMHLIVLGSKSNESRAKKINHAVSVVFSEDRVQVLPTVFKRIVYESAEDAKGFLASLNLHIQIAIKMGPFDGFNHHPCLLRVCEKGNGKIKIEIQEPKCECDLVVWQENLGQFLNGMIRIANYLIETREKGVVHRDVKRGNILVHRNAFFLNDFKLSVPIGYKGNPEKYFAWCSTAEKLGIITSFTDVYGWAIAFGCSLWDKHFLNLAMDKDRLYTDALEKEIWRSLCEQDLIPNEVASPRYANKLESYEVDPHDEIKVHFLFYRFLKKILACDQANLKHYKENPDKPNPVAQITLEDCIIFVGSLR